MYPNLKLQLWKTGIRQNLLAKRLGIHESMLSKILNGFREPDERVRQRIATLLKSDETWLFERVETDAENGILPARSSTAGEKS